MKRSMLPLVLALLAVRVLAAEAAAPLTLDDCLKLSVAQHPALTAAHAGVTAAGEAMGEARAPYYPQVDLSAGYHRWQRRAFLPSGLALPGGRVPELIGPLDDWNGGLVSRMTLLDFGERQASVDGAQARRAGAAADEATTVAEVRLGVQSAFYALAAAQELHAVAERNLQRAESHRQLADARRQAGAVPQADVLRTLADVADARLQLIGAESRVRISTGRLNAAMGRAAETPLEVTATLATMPPPSREELAAAAERALDRRSEMQAEGSRTAAARAAVAAARASRAPKVRADASYGWRDTAWVPETNEWAAGVTVEVPIFDGASRARRVARTKAELARQEAALEGRRLQIREEVWSAGSELERAWAAIAASEASVQANAESLRVVRERYENGAALVTDLLDTQTALARAEAGLAEARWSYLRARATFDRVVGVGAEPE